MWAFQNIRELQRSPSFCLKMYLSGHCADHKSIFEWCRFLEARLEEADARRSSFEKQARQIAQSTKELRRSTSSDLQRCG